MFRLTSALLLVLTAAAPAAAQSPPAEPPLTQSIGGAAHWALPYPGGNASPGVQVTWRSWRSAHMGIGTDVRWWRRNTVTDINTPAQQAPGGIPVPAQQGRVDERLGSYCVGVGLLGRTQAGRLSVIGGAGPGIFVESRQHDSRINASHSTGSVTQRSVGVQALMELEMRAMGRVSVFAGLRIELRDVRSMESNSGYPTAGIRLAF